MSAINYYVNSKTIWQDVAVCLWVSLFFIFIWFYLRIADEVVAFYEARPPRIRELIKAIRDTVYFFSAMFLGACLYAKWINGESVMVTLIVILTSLTISFIMQNRT